MVKRASFFILADLEVLQSSTHLHAQIFATAGVGLKALHMRHFRGLDRDHLSRGCRGQILGERLDQKKPSIAALPRWHVPPKSRQPEAS